MKGICALLAALAPAALACGLDYSLATDYCFIHKREKFFIDGYFAANSPASIDKRGFNGSQLTYSEGASAIFLNAYPAEDHAFSFEFGYGQMKVDFANNPSFKQKHFHDAIFSIGYITTVAKDWRWILNVGVHANLDYFHLSKSAFYTGMFWGRLAYTPPLGIHIGLVGQKGLKSTYLFPILGLD